MMRYISISIFVALLAMPNPSLPQGDSINVISPVDGGFLESFQKNKRLLPAFVFGAEFEEDSRNFNSDEIYIHLPTASSGFICLQMNTIDGDYWADAEYSITDMESGTWRLSFPTGHSEDLSQYMVDDVAILATIKSDCNGPAEAVILASSEPVAPRQFVLYVSSGDYRVSVEIPHRDGGSVSFRCDEIGPSPVVRMFDAVCILPNNRNLLYIDSMLKRTRLAGSEPRPFGIPLALPE